jgi:hypothetical protein
MFHYRLITVKKILRDGPNVTNNEQYNRLGILDVYNNTLYSVQEAICINAFAMSRKPSDSKRLSNFCKSIANIRNLISDIGSLAICIP